MGLWFSLCKTLMRLGGPGGYFRCVCALAWVTDSTNSDETERTWWLLSMRLRTRLCQFLCKAHRRSIEIWANQIGGCWSWIIQLYLRCFFREEHSINRGSYTSGHFICLWNEPLASFINFIWNDHECKILFIIWLFKMGFYRLLSWHYFNRKHNVVTDGVMTLRASNQVLCNV